MTSFGIDDWEVKLLSSLSTATANEVFICWPQTARPLRRLPANESRSKVPVEVAQELRLVLAMVIVMLLALPSSFLRAQAGKLSSLSMLPSRISWVLLASSFSGL